MFKYLIPLLLIYISLWGDRVSDNIEKAQKVIFISFDNVGFEKSLLEVPLYDCSNGCEEIRRWSIPLEPDYISKIKNEVESNSIGKRFDRVFSSDDNFVLKSRDNIFVEKFKGPPFPNDTLDFNNYRELVKNYINSSDYQKPLKKLLLKSIQDRLTLKSSKPISEDLKLKLIKKSFLYYIYIDQLEGELRSVQSRKDGGFSLKTDIDLILKAVVYKYNPEESRFTIFSTFDGGSLNIDATDNIQELYSLNYFDSNYSTFPRRLDGEIEFKRELKNSFREALSEILEKMERVNEFKSHSPVISVEKSVISFDQVGGRDNLRVNAPIYLQKIDPESGEMKSFAWGRVKVLEDKNSTTYDSKAQIIGGRADDNITYTTLPYWSGYVWGVSGGVVSHDLNHKGSKVASVSSSQLSAKVSIDIGYLSNKEFLSNFLLNLSLFTESQTLSIDQLSSFDSLNFSYLYGYDIELEYRYFLKGPIYLSGVAGVTGRLSQYDVRYFNQVINEDGIHRAYGDGTLNIISHHLKLGGILGFAISPNLEIFGEVSYSLPVMESSSIERNGIEIYMDYIDEKEFGYSSALEMKFGLSFNSESFSESLSDIVKWNRESF